MRNLLLTVLGSLIFCFNAYSEALPACNGEELQEIVDFFGCNPTNSEIDAPADDAPDSGDIGSDILSFMEMSCGCGEEGEKDPDQATACKKLLGKTLIEKNKKKASAFSNLTSTLTAFKAMELLDQDTLDEIKNLAKSCPKY